MTTGAIPTLGSVMQGTTVSDFEPEEIHHRSSVSTSLLRCSWNQTTINLLDTPGALSLLGEAIAALHAADAVIVVLTPSSGIRSELIRLWSQVKALGLPCLIFVNELEKESGSVEERSRPAIGIWRSRPLPMSCLWKDGAQWMGVMDFMGQQAIHSGRHREMAAATDAASSAETIIADARKRIQEAAAECDDQLLEQYVSAGAELSQADVLAGLRAGVQAGTVVPLYVGSALKNIGTVPLLNAIVDLLPSPADRAERPAARRGRIRTVTTTSAAGCAAEAPFSAVIFKTIIDPFVGRLSYVRVASGSLAGRFACSSIRDAENQREKRSSVSVAGQETYGRRPGGRRGHRGDRQTQRCADRRHAMRRGASHRLFLAGFAQTGAVVCDRTQVECRHR